MKTIDQVCDELYDIETGLSGRKKYDVLCEWVNEIIEVCATKAAIKRDVACDIEQEVNRIKERL